MENTNNQQNTQTVVTKKSVKKVKRVLANKSIFFAIFIVIFALVGFLLFCLDEDNFLRKKMPALDPVANFFKGMGIHFNVTMLTWLIFFMFVIVFFAVFTTLFFRKTIKNKINTKTLYKKGHPMTKKQSVTFNVFYYLLAALVMGGLIATVSVLVIPLLPANQRSAEFFGQNIGNTFATIGITLLLVAIFPAACILLYLIFKIIVFIISLFASGVSKSVMQSEEYQETLATTQAAAQDIAKTLADAREYAADAVSAAKNAKGLPRRNPLVGVTIFPALDTIDKGYQAIEDEKKAKEEAKKAREEAIAGGADPATLPEVVDEAPVEEVKDMTYEDFQRFAFEFQSYLCHNKFYFDLTIIRSFIAGLAASRMILLEGLSGTGKTTLPRVFLDYIGSRAWFFPVQATWRDRSDVTGYFSEFSNEFKETEFLKHLYEASYTPDKVNLLVLDEMNISRVEYYFADFLSIFEYPSSDWLVPLIQVHDGVTMPKKLEDGKVRIQPNTWFIGTVNIDDSTFTITDKVYDRVIAIDFEELNIPFESEYSFEPHPLKCGDLERMFEEAKAHEENVLSDDEKMKFLELSAFTAETFDIKFGNRIMNQIENFVPVFVALGGTKEEALDLMYANKILRKLNGKYESYIRDGLVKLTRYLNSEYGKGVFKKTEKLISIISKKLA